jgi:DNA-binding MarR family transcriptional regulator
MTDLAERTGTAEPTRWLSEPEQEAWRAYLRGSRLLESVFDRDLQRHGLQLSEYEILSMLSETESRRMRMSELAALVVQSRSRLTHTATRLERSAWVRREPCQGDRRGVELVLTDEGYAQMARIAPLHVESVRAHLVDLLSSTQLLELGRIMAVVAAGVEGTGDCQMESEA